MCIRAVDRQGNKGPPSNPAALWLPRPPSTDQVTIRARGPGEGGGHDEAAAGGNTWSNGSENESKCAGKVVVIALLIGTFAVRAAVMVMMELACMMTKWCSLNPITGGVLQSSPTL